MIINTWSTILMFLATMPIASESVENNIEISKIASSDQIRLKDVPQVTKKLQKSGYACSKDGLRDITCTKIKSGFISTCVMRVNIKITSYAIINVPKNACTSF